MGSPTHPPFQRSSGKSAGRLERARSQNYSPLSLERAGSQNYSPLSLERAGSHNYSPLSLKRVGSGNISKLVDGGEICFSLISIYGLSFSPSLLIHIIFSLTLFLSLDQFL